jgi:YD repeat-containing protein
VDTLTRSADLAGATLVGTTEYDYDAGGRVTAVVTKDGTGATLLATGSFNYPQVRVAHLGRSG